MSHEGRNSETGQQEQKREVWTNKREYILSQIGYAVGLGTFWRFPYLCNRNGGGAFIIPYFCGIFLCGVPLFFLEVSIGQFSSRSAAHVWDICPLFKGIGISQAVVCFSSSISYNLIIVWTLYYLYQSFWPMLPWTTCNNWWNTALCADDMGSNTTHNDSSYQLMNDPRIIAPWRKPNETLTAAEEFWQYNAIRISDGVETMGSVQTHLLLCSAASWAILFLCMMSGVKSVGKVVYVTAVLPYILLTVLLIRSCMMPGSVEGILYFLRPDFSKLHSVQVWLEALLQSFYSLNTTYGGLITMGSFNSFNNNCVRDVVLVTIVSQLTCIFCGFTVFSTLGFMANDAQVPISEVVSSGSGLGFIIYPEAISKMPLSQLWAVLFFLTLLTVGIDSMTTETLGAMVTTYFDPEVGSPGSQTNLFQPVQYSLTASNFSTRLYRCWASVLTREASPKWLQSKRVLITLVVCLLSFLITVPFVTEGGVYLFQLLDWYSSSFNVLLIGCLECVVIYWIYGSERFGKDIKKMLDRRPPTSLTLLLSYVIPVILFAALVVSLFGYDPPSYGEYLYPEIAKTMGILLAVVFSVPIPVMFVYECLRKEGSICQRVRLASRPAPDWGPLYDRTDMDVRLMPLSGLRSADNEMNGDILKL